jgi:hypothetical protein
MAGYYGSVAGGDSYFATRLHSTAWDYASASEKLKSLYTATRYMDRLNYKGQKSTVYTALENDPEAIDSALRTADLLQELEFPRDTDTSVPLDIEIACYEIAFALLDGVDPDIELENLGVQSQVYAGVRTSYNRDQQPIEHLIHGIPSPLAWRLLKPFLRDGKQIRIDRVG